MPTPQTVHLGELLVPGASRVHGARTFMLTKPAGDGALELLFGAFAADAPKRVVDKLVDRITDELRPAYFRDGLEADLRFEAALKLVNRIILTFLHEHGLSLPGIRLRGAIGALSGMRLFISSRGGFRGSLAVPKAGRFELFQLFDESSESQTSPKFFSSLQSGTIVQGARLHIASVELFRSLDESFVNRLLSETDSAAATKTMKNALKDVDAPTTLLTLATPLPESFALGNDPAPSAKRQRNSKAQAPVLETPLLAPAGPDIGQIVARGMYALLAGLMRGARQIPRLGDAFGRLLLSGMRRLPELGRRTTDIFRASSPRVALVAAAAAPDRLISHGIDRLNGVEPHRRVRFLAIFLLVNLFAHGTIWTIKRQMVVGEAKAYEARLAEFQRLETDLESSLIYGNDDRSREIYTRLEAIAVALPETTPAQKRAKLEALQDLESSQEHLRRIVDLPSPAVFASFEDADGRFKGAPVGWFKGGLYVFSPQAPEVIAIGTDGTAAPPMSLKGMSTGTLDVAPATTGFLILGADGRVRYWNPDGETAVEYADTLIDRGSPILFWQGRLYNAGPDRSIVRRPVLDRRFGPAVAAVTSPSQLPTVSDLAADGALYALSPDGTIHKYMKGAPVSDFHSPVIDPPTSGGARDLWTSTRSPWIIFTDRGSDRIIVVDKVSGRLGGQLTSSSFSPITSVAADESGENLYVLSGSRVFKIGLTITGGR